MSSNNGKNTINLDDDNQSILRLNGMLDNKNSNSSGNKRLTLLRNVLANRRSSNNVEQTDDSRMITGANHNSDIEDSDEDASDIDKSNADNNYNDVLSSLSKKSAPKTPQNDTRSIKSQGDLNSPPVVTKSNNFEHVPQFNYSISDDMPIGDNMYNTNMRSDNKFDSSTTVMARDHYSEPEYNMDGNDEKSKSYDRDTKTDITYSPFDIEKEEVRRRTERERQEQMSDDENNYQLDDNIDDIGECENTNNNKYSPRKLCPDDDVNDDDDDRNALGLNYAISPGNGNSVVKTLQQERQLKADLIAKINHLSDKGYAPAQHPNMSMTLNELENMHCRQDTKYKRDKTIQTYRKWYLIIILTVENVTKWLDGLEIYLDGWSKSIADEVEDLDEILGELYDKYRVTLEMPPEAKLLLFTVKSGLFYHFSSKAINSQKSHPELERLFSLNPELKAQYIKSMQMAKDNGMTDTGTNNDSGGGFNLFSIGSMLFGGGGDLFGSGGNKAKESESSTATKKGRRGISVEELDKISGNILGGFGDSENSNNKEVEYDF